MHPLIEYQYLVGSFRSRGYTEENPAICRMTAEGMLLIYRGKLRLGFPVPGVVVLDPCGRRIL